MTIRRTLLFATAITVAAAAAAMASLVLPVGNAARSALPTGNLVKNPGGEVPFGADINTKNIAPAAWESDDDPGKPGGGLQVVRYGTHQFVLLRPLSAAIGGGRNFFAGGYASMNSVGFQTIDVSGAGSEIDGGGVKACLSAYLGGGIEGAGVTNALARAQLQFLGEDGSALGQLALRPVNRGQRQNAKTLLWRASERALPTGTRMLKVVLALDGFFSNGAFADNVSVALTKGKCQPALVVRCTKGTLVATVNPSNALKTQRVRFLVMGKKGRKLVTDARAPYAARVPMKGITGRPTVTATVTHAGSGNVVLKKKSRRC